jgi:hypothetical protein
MWVSSSIIIEGKVIWSSGQPRQISQKAEFGMFWNKAEATGAIAAIA